MEVSSFLYVGVDPDTGDPSSIKVFEENDFISSSRLPDQVRNVVDYTTEQSGTFGAGSLDSAVSGRWESAYEEVRDTSADLRQASATLNTASGNWQNTYEEVRDTSADLRDVSSAVTDNSGFWQDTYNDIRDPSAYITSAINTRFTYVDANGDASTAYVSGYGPGDTRDPQENIQRNYFPIFSEALSRFIYKKLPLQSAGGTGDPIELAGDGPVLEIDSGNQTMSFVNGDGGNSLIIDTSSGYLSGTTDFDISGIRRLSVATIDSNTTSAVNLTVEDELDVQSDANVFLPRGYRATSQDRFAVNGSGIGSGADNLYVINGAGPFIYYETSTNGSIRNGINELGLGATPGYTISSIADSYLSGTISGFYDNSAYCRTVVSSTGVYEIQAMLNVSSVSEIDVVYYVEIDDTPDMTLADTIVGISAPHYRLAKLQKIKFLTAGQEIKITIYAGAQHIIGSGSNLLIRRIG